MRRTLTGYSILISIQSYQLHSSFMDIWKITEKDGYWELLKHKDVNIIAVDWEKGCKAAVCPCMRQSQVNWSNCGILYSTSNGKKEFHVSPEQIHVIGHSLGAHVSGEVGERIPGIGRITGLDPAMPFFHRVHKKLRIDPGDAKFVDIIHTDGRSSIINGFGLGMAEPCGHMDFYPNGGRQSKARNQISAVSNSCNKVALKSLLISVFQRKIVIKTENEGTSRSHDPQRGKININIRGKNGVSEFKRNLNLDSASNIVFMTGTYGVDPIRDFHLNWKHKVSLPKSQNMA
ncbi:Pancreatic lipase-related protein 3 [Nymphon striatum]|nr:Pancreatic lipase-related protein 3 [Nymphon striatum]KAG1694116.1 Pancreatic lipase-related protein 3 [Nymphon striatum]KAG1694119.1 Pancreatic lipase-related protein 3 [Nymphon striatum]